MFIIFQYGWKNKFESGFYSINLTLRWSFIRSISEFPISYQHWHFLMKLIATDWNPTSLTIFIDSSIWLSLLLTWVLFINPINLGTSLLLAQSLSRYCKHSTTDKGKTLPIKARQSTLFWPEEFAEPESHYYV